MDVIRSHLLTSMTSSASGTRLDAYYPVVTIPNQVISFKIAIGLICLHCTTVEVQAEPLHLFEPYDDKNLFLRLQILASRIAGEVGWDSAAA